MNSIDTTHTASAAIARAAALLDGVARDSEAAVDFEVPIRCGQAANRLYTVLRATTPAVPLVGDDFAAIRAAVSQAITLLGSLPPEELVEPVLDALVQARAAALATQNGSAR
jgi:hypothetical protein